MKDFQKAGRGMISSIVSVVNGGWIKAGARLAMVMVVIGAGGLVACGSNPTPTGDPNVSTAVTTMTADAYRLGPRDRIRIIVFGEPDLSGSFEVDTTGAIAMPLIGEAQIGGKTTREAETSLAQALNVYLKQPRVSIEVEQNRPFYISGEVKEAGEYPYVNNMHVLMAVSMAGGYTVRANRRDIYVTRAGTTKEVVLPADSETRIGPGDIVRVAERKF